jgi:DNA-binding NarL/FixJ family response regulator
VIRVLLADDQALVRGGFRLILDAEPDIEVVAEAADGEQAVAGALETKPDLVLMDIRMPVLDGIEATRRLVPQLGATRVVMLTTFDLDDYVVDAFRAGASGFLLKTAPPPQLVAAIRTVHAGDGLLAPASTRRLIEQFAQPASPGPKLQALTARESDVLRLLARGLSNAEIAAQLVVESSTVKSHVASVLAKLNLRDRVQAVVFAYENGLVRPGAHEPGPLGSANVPGCPLRDSCLRRRGAGCPGNRQGRLVYVTTACTARRNSCTAVWSRLACTALVSRTSHRPAAGSRARLVPVKPVCDTAVGGQWPPRMSKPSPGQAQP